MKKHIPNFLTCCNLLCGSLGVVYILRNEEGASGWLSAGVAPAYFVWAACVFDFFDGFAARALKVSSPIGKELDSLADVVSFGLLPSVFMYDYMQRQATSSETIIQYVPFIAFMIVIFSALRLAIFNIDETQKDSFRGLPTPANALFITALPFLQLPLLESVIALSVITIVFSLLLVSRIELFALKFKNFTWNENKIRFTFLILSVLLLVLLQQAAIPVLIILYVLLSLTARVFARES
jgi:CDP-diacylglycerol---serine O-phosphatidyltransferase